MCLYVLYVSVPVFLQVDRREEEIERLNEMLKGGRPPEALAAEGAKHTNERVMAHLNIQVRTHSSGVGGGSKCQIGQIGIVVVVVVVVVVGLYVDCLLFVDHSGVTKQFM